MTGRIAEASPRFKAKIAGVLYFLNVLTAEFGEFVRGRLGFAAGLIVVPPQCVKSCTGFFVSHNSGQPELGGDRFKSLQYLRPPFVYRNGWMSRRASPR